MQIEKMRAFIIKVVFYGLILGFVYAAFKYVLPVLTPFILGFLLAFMLKPLVNRITDKTGWKRSVVAVLTLIVFYVLFNAACIFLGNKLVVFVKNTFSMLPAFYAETIEPSLVSLQDILGSSTQNLDPSLQAVVENAGQNITDSLSGLVKSLSSGALGKVTSLASGLPGFFVGMLVTIVSSFFCAADYYKITAFIVRQLPPGGRDMLFKIKVRGVDVMFKFTKAYALLLLLTFVELSIGLTILHIPYSVLLALVIAIVDILPVLGTGTVLIPWAVVNLVLGNFSLGVGLFILYVIILVVRQSLEPRVVGHQIGLYPLVTLVCMFVGSYLFGFVGLFGLPITVTVLVQLTRSGDFKLFK